MSIPVAFLHYGECPYLRFTLQQAKISNPNSDVYLIGDEACIGSASWESTRLAAIQEYTTNVDITRWYKHFSPNDYKYEQFCIERFFILRNFMVKNHLRKCTYLDSDNFLFLNEQDRDEIGYEILFNHYCLSSLESLEHFCSFVTEHYMYMHLFQQLQEFLNTLEGYEGLSDMVLLEYFRFLFPDEACILPEQAKNRFICKNINMPEGLEAIRGMKKIYYSGGRLYGKCENPVHMIPMGFLHFQGIAKEHMEPIFSHHGLGCDTSIKFYDYETHLWLEG